MTQPGWFPDPMSPVMVRWWDGQRWTNDVRPGSPGLNPAADVADEAKAGRMASLALWAGAVTYTGRTLLTAVLLHRLWVAFRKWLDIPAGSRDRFILPPGVTAINLLTQLFSLGTLVVGVLFLIWFYKAAQIAARAGLPSRHSPAWAIAGWIVPVVNFWFPYQAAVDLLPPGHPGRGRVRLWWALWLALNVLSLLVVAASLVSLGVGLLVAGLASAAAFAAAWAGRSVIDHVDGVHAELAGRR